ncbi:MAG: hypothetical protein ACUVSV_15205 [Armatimonadota bacterium]
MSEHTGLPVLGMGIAAAIVAIGLSWRNMHKTGDRRWLRHLLAMIINLMVLSSASYLRHLPLEGGWSDFIAILLLGLSATSFMLLFSYTNFSNDDRRNSWWSGFLQGLACSFFLAIALILLLYY